jgi:hypothetical protein
MLKVSTSLFVVTSLALVAGVGILFEYMWRGVPWEAGFVAPAQFDSPPAHETVGSAGPPNLDRLSSADIRPVFDIVRIEPGGDAIIAGRGAPGASVELLRDGEIHDKAIADASGAFVMVPPRLPAGHYELTLVSRQPDGKQATSTQRVTVVLPPSPAE